MKEKLVIVGGGMAAWHFLKTLAAQNASEKFDVILFTEERVPLYDRVHLSRLFSGHNVQAKHDIEKEKSLLLVDKDWLKLHHVLVVHEKIVSIDRDAKTVKDAKNNIHSYDKLVLSTGSRAFVPPFISGCELDGVFVYRSIADIENMNSYRSSDHKPRKCTVLGGGVLGLECAGSLLDAGMEVTVVELLPYVMSLQLGDHGGHVLRRSLEKMGMYIETGRRCVSLQPRTDDPMRVGSVTFASTDPTTPVDPLDTDMVVLSVGIRPRDELAKACGLEIAPKGGIAVDEFLNTSDPNVFAIGECASRDQTIYGLVAPCNVMADSLALRLCVPELKPKAFSFNVIDQVVKLKMAGVDVASIGDAFGETEPSRSLVYIDEDAGIYRRIFVSKDLTHILGAVLVGAAEDYSMLLAAVRNKLGPVNPATIALPRSVIEAVGGATKNDMEDLDLPSDAVVCTCTSTTKQNIVDAINENNLTTVGQIEAATSAGSGCGGCVPMISLILDAELKKMGKAVEKPKGVCPTHFPDHTRQMLTDLIKVKEYRTFDEIYDTIGVKPTKGVGCGCNTCKVELANIIASVNNEFLGNQQAIQDTNDKFLSNIQRGGLYSVIPRQPAGEITAEQLIAMGDIAREYSLYPKITSQRVGLFGARVTDLPAIWKKLNEVELETGTAYSKSLRNVKACIGDPWCHLSMGRSVDFAVKMENRYKNIRSPHKMKGGTSGCLRDCGEAKAKDFGAISTGPGRYTLFVGGNAGATPRHADILATDVDEETAVKYLDRYLMFYLRTAAFGMRTARWIEKMDGGIDHLIDVVVNDKLGIAADLEAEMTRLSSKFQDEWRTTLETPELLSTYKEFGNDESAQQTASPSAAMTNVNRGHLEPGMWPVGDVADTDASEVVAMSAAEINEFVKIGVVDDVRDEMGMNFKVKDHQVAVFKLKGGKEWRAIQSRCPHKGDNILHRGNTGTNADGTPTVACPFHRKVFSLDDGSCETGGDFAVRTLPVEIRGNEIWVSSAVKDTAGLCGSARATMEW